MNPEFRILTKKNIILFYFFFSISLGYANGNRLLIALGFGLFILYLCARRSSEKIARCLKGERIHYPRTFEETQMRISIRLSQESTIPLYMPEITDIFPVSDSWWIHALVPTKLDNRSRIELEYSAVCTRRRGFYVLGPIEVNMSDPLGIHQRKVELPVFTNLLIYPKAPELGFFEVLGDGTLIQVGVETLLLPGHSEEFTSLREYHEGDNPRRIHWPSSARHERFLVKEFREEITTEVSLILDMRRLALSGVGDITSVEYIIKSAAAVAQVSIEKGHLVQLFSLGGKLEHVSVGGGTQHLITILDRLTLLRPQSENPFHEYLNNIAPQLRKGSTAVLIASATDIQPSNLSPVLRSMMERRIKIIAILIDDRTFIKFWKDQEAHRKRAIPLAELKEILSVEGCGLFLLSKGDDVPTKLQVPL